MPEAPFHMPCSRLLVVDDEAVQRLLVKRAAEQRGFATDTAATLPEAAAALAGAPYDVVVLDLSLRDHDGIELLRAIYETRSDPIIIFISGFDERVRQAAARLAIALGLRVAGTLGKPLPLDRLDQLLGSIPERLRHKSDVATPEITADELRQALARGEFRCLYQPKLRLADRRIVGLEVLTRWESPARGLVTPDAFIPAAERFGLIDELTYWILGRSLAAFRPWRTALPELSLAVNLSPLTLVDLSLPERISEALEASGTPPTSLVLEVTESAVMTDYVAAADILTRLRIRRVRISIDDFGTGHASLLSLLRLPFNEIKIDQSFVRGLLHDPEAAKIVRAVIRLADEMDVDVVAEGIETEPVARRLAALGCRVGQGFLFAPPLAEAVLAPQLGQPIRAVA